ncbi:MAG: hypothetical protein HYY14_04880 [Candidatus Omnitrophica bacterium]|nr:hypothetical protein [Candidatus Omnitrophota bacterium]
MADGFRSKPGLHLGGILVRKGYITETQLISALEEQKRTKELLGEILVRRGHVTEEQLTYALAVRFRMPLIVLKSFQIDWEVAKKFGTTLVIEHRCFPLDEDEETLTVAITNPLDAQLKSELGARVGMKRINFVLVTPQEMRVAMEQYRHKVIDQIQSKLKKRE